MDSMIAARAVGNTGAVVGVDMTPEMLDRDRDSAAEVGVTNVEFRAAGSRGDPSAVDVVEIGVGRIRRSFMKIHRFPASVDRLARVRSPSRRDPSDPPGRSPAHSGVGRPWGLVPDTR